MPKTKASQKSKSRSRSINIGLTKRGNRFSSKSMLGALVALVAIGGYIVIHGLAANQAPHGNRWGDFGITPGTGTFLATDTLQANLNTFNDLGARWIRSSILWRSFEPDAPQPGHPPVFTWSKVDAFTSILNNHQNVGRFRIIVTLEGPPSWSKPNSVSGCPDPQTPFNIDQYAAAAAALAGHLKGQNIHVFEIENSPNIGAHSVKGEDGNTTTRGLWADANPCAYAKLLMKTYTAVHAARPDAVVLVGGLGGSSTELDSGTRYLKLPGDDFLADIYASRFGKACNGHSCFDGVAYHAYSWPDSPCSIDPNASNACYAAKPSHALPDSNHNDPNGPQNGWDRMVNAHQNIMVPQGDGAKRIWVTEYGYPGIQNLAAKAKYSEKDQADHITEAFQQAATIPWLGPLCVYTLNDGTDTDHVYSIYMGIKTEAGVKKTAYSAYKGLTAGITRSSYNASDSDASEF